MSPKLVKYTAILNLCLMIFSGLAVAAEPTPLDEWHDNELTERELADVPGEVWGIVVAGGLIGLADYAITNWDEEKDSDWYVRGATATLTGAVFAGTGSVLASQTRSHIAKGAVAAYSWAKERVTQWALSFNDDTDDNQTVD